MASFQSQSARPSTPTRGICKLVLISAFKAATSYRNDLGGKDLALFDSDNDGDIDALTVNSFGTSGNGTFAYQVTNGFGDGSYTALTTIGDGNYGYTRTGDINNDGYDDLVIDGGNFTFTQLSNGDGTFQARTTATNFTNTQGLTLHDLDNDGNLDILLNYPGGILNSRVSYGNGDGSFNSYVELEGVTAGSESELSLIDVNNDGLKDIVTKFFDVEAYIANADGSFKAKVSYDATSSPRKLAFADS